MRGEPGNSGGARGVSKMLDTAALGTTGFIAIDPHSLNSAGSTMIELAAEACNVLASHRRSPRVVTPYRNPSAERNSLGLLVLFGKEAELDRAIGPYTISGIKTQLVRFCVENTSAYILELGLFSEFPRLLKTAFEDQSGLKVKRWGWYSVKGAKIGLALQIKEIPAHEIESVYVDGLRLKCSQVGDGRKCCCCGGAHDCFSKGSGCKQYLPGRA